MVLKGLFCLNGNPLVNFEGQNLFLNYLFFLIVAVIACTPLPRILYHRVCSSTNGAAIAWAPCWSTCCRWPACCFPSATLWGILTTPSCTCSSNGKES